MLCEESASVLETSIKVTMYRGTLNYKGPYDMLDTFLRHYRQPYHLIIHVYF